RLLAVDIFAGVHGIDADGAVPVVGSSDDDGVNVGAREHFAVVAGGEEVAAPGFFSAGEAAFVNVADGDEFDSRDLDGVGGIAASLPAGSDESDPDAVIGRGLGESGGGRGRRSEEMPPGGGHVTSVPPIKRQ